MGLWLISAGKLPHSYQSPLLSPYTGFHDKQFVHKWIVDDYNGVIFDVKFQVTSYNTFGIIKPHNPLLSVERKWEQPVVGFGHCLHLQQDVGCYARRGLEIYSFGLKSYFLEVKNWGTFLSSLQDTLCSFSSLFLPMFQVVLLSRPAFGNSSIMKK